ncbi:unnamed protein product [Rodentolepis nana]|uniref:Zinc finger CCHC domain-containing protein 7 n=1 Tax=Rodentolepis nana TaxID=102285 RepID=A0A0R3T392_RODNA|nr:unnamed protein product [Rodentolepis nana]
MADEIDYYSDQIDEETEARFYEMSYYGTSSLGNSTVDMEKVDNCSHQRINASAKADDKWDPTPSEALDLLSNLQIEGSSESSSDSNLSQSVVSTSSCLSYLADILKDKDRYQTDLEALYLLITGNYPHCVLERAEKREQEYKNNCSSSRPNSYYSAATDDDDDSHKDTYGENAKTDMILGISNTLSQNNSQSVAMPSRLDNLPSDPKFWSIEHDDIYPPDEYTGIINRKCCICGLKGHSGWDCKRRGTFCIICTRQGHHGSRCSYRVCPVCLNSGHDNKCPDKEKVNSIVCSRCKQRGHVEDRCPEIWRQYRFTTKPGPPVKFEQPEPHVISCFNCGRIGHLGHECDRPSVYGQFLLNQGVTQFDEEDVYAEASSEEESSEEESSEEEDEEEEEKEELKYEVVEKQSSSDSSVDRAFDEPLYVSFSSGPLNSPPKGDQLLLDTSKDDSQNRHVHLPYKFNLEQSNVDEYDRRRYPRYNSNYTPNRNRRRDSRDHSPPSFSRRDFRNSGWKKGRGKWRVDDKPHQNGRSNLFISNGFTPKNNKRDDAYAVDNVGFRGKSPRNPSFNGSRGNHNRQMKRSTGFLDIVPLINLSLKFSVDLDVKFTTLPQCAMANLLSLYIENVLTILGTIKEIEENLLEILGHNLLVFIALLDAGINKIVGKLLTHRESKEKPNFENFSGGMETSKPFQFGGGGMLRLLCLPLLSALSTFFSFLVTSFRKGTCFL